MTGVGSIRIILGLATAILGAIALYLARSIFAPVAFSLFVIAIVWPLQKMLQSRMPKPAALALVLITTLIVITALGSMIVWGFGITSQWLLNNAARFQALYLRATNWLEEHDIFIVALIGERFDVLWMVGFVKDVAGRLNSILGFSILVVIFTMIGLLEVDDFKEKLESLDNNPKRRLLSQAGEETAAKFRRYMLVRTLASMLTGVLTYGFALFANLELAAAWGVIAFALNYIPFIGSLVATILPAMFAIVQFESWQMPVVIFIGLMAIQFLIGNYLEPRLSGRFLDISPYTVLFAVFFWSFLWGIPGAFLGVPLTIALLTACEQDSSTRWVAVLLSGRPPKFKSPRAIGR